MNIKNKKMIGNIYFFSFFKRAFICFLCIILCFNVVCKPKKTYAATLGVAVTWGLVDYLAALVASAGIALTVDGFCRGLGLYGGDEEVTEEEALQWCKNNISIDGDNNVVFTDDAKAFINDYLLGTYNDSVTMTYRYPTPVQCISAENFPNNTIYQALIKTCMAYPNCYVLTSNSYHGFQQSGVYMALDGSVSSCRFDTYWWYVIPEPFAGVSQYLDLATASTTFYNDNWEDYFIPRKFVFTPDGRAFYQVNEELAGYAGYLAEFDIDNFPLLDDVDKGMDWAQFGTSYTTFLDNSYSASLCARPVYSASPNALHVYKSVADM